MRILKASSLGLFLSLCALGLGCSKQPTLSYSARPNTPIERFRDVALDPREDLIIAVEGMRPVGGTEIKAQVIAELQAKGYRVVPSDQAELWVDVWTLTPGGLEHMRPMSGYGRQSKSLHAGGGSVPFEGDNRPRGNTTASKLMVIVQLVERSSTDMVWSGTLDLPLPKPNPKDPGNATHELITDQVKQLLGLIPARP
jgi:hypothetical protein